jgi:hypothetical protein
MVFIIVWMYTFWMLSQCFIPMSASYRWMLSQCFIPMDLSIIRLYIHPHHYISIVRTIQLNKWFGALLKVYANLPIEAQKLILRLMEASSVQSNQQESFLSYGEGLRLGAVKRDDAIVDM